MADAEKAIKGVLNSRTEEDGAVMYKVRYVGMDKSGDEWVKADAVSQEHVKNFEKRKAKKSTQDAPPKPQVEKKRKAEVLPCPGAAFHAPPSLPSRCSSMSSVSVFCVCVCVCVSEPRLVDGRRRQAMVAAERKRRMMATAMASRKGRSWSSTTAGLGLRPVSTRELRTRGAPAR
jgi:hypothetical protein